MDPSTPAVTLEHLGLTPETAASLPEGVRRQVVRFLLRWGDGQETLPLLPDRDRHAPHAAKGHPDALPRDRFDRCRALLAAGGLKEAQGLARELVNAPDAGDWGHRAVGEVFLALGKGERADERFRAGADPVGRARAYLVLGGSSAALDLLRSLPAEDPDAERVRLAALRLLGEETREVELRLHDLFEAELAELREALGIEGTHAPLPPVFDPGGRVSPDAVRTALQRLFGYEEFRPGQFEVIAPLLEGRSVLGLMPTGAGKSLCFQLPAALLPGATVVISPLIALMKDQIDGLPPFLYRRATLINSSLEAGDAERRLDLVSRGEVSLIYAAPERLRQRSFVRALQRRGVSLFVVDEAHCVSLWGHDFRPDYFFIRQALQDLGRPTVLAVTATATAQMQEDIARQLEVRFERVNLGTFRPNLSFSIRKVAGDGPRWVELLALLREEKGPAIIYVDRRKLAEELAFKLRQEEIRAEAYHAGLDRETRDRAQTRFMMGETRVIVATVAFGMGVDKADVRLVVHYNLPRCLEAYYQEAGRAGRDGLPARCVLFYSSYDQGSLTRRVQQDRIQAAEILKLYRTLVHRTKHSDGPITIDDLQRECGTTDIRVRVGVSLLQRLGLVERSYDLPATAWLAIRRLAVGSQRSAVSGQQSAAGGQPEERFTRFVSALGLSAGDAVTLPAARLAQAAGVAPEGLEATLLDWEEAGWLRYRAGGRGMGIRLAPGAAELEREVTRAVEQMAQMDVQRLVNLTRFLNSAECRQAFVSAYFGLPLEEGCGACDTCRAAVFREAERVREERRSARYGAGDGMPISDEESSLFEHLRAWRREKAREEGVPAYVVFHDRVLYAIARARPRTLAQLAEVPGVTRGLRLQSYGEEVLEIVKRET